MAECQQQPLGRIVHRCVCGFLVDVKSFEMHPHRMSWIRQTSMGERIGGQQVAEFVMNRRFGNRQYRQHSCPRGKRRESNDDHCEPGPFNKRLQETLHSPEMLPG